MKTAGRAILVLAMLIISWGCGAPQEQRTTLQLTQVESDLRTVAGARVFFGHQSVGRNILDGIRMLSERTGVAIRIEEVGDGPPPAGAGLFHANVGENGMPGSKIDEFASRVGGAGEASYDAAVLKFCYVDLEEADVEIADPAELFLRYRDMISTLQSTRPGLSIVPATMPLMAEPPGKKTRIKRLLGMATWRDEANRLRNEYNAMVRSELSTPELFDIARIEATHADGTRSTFNANGERIEMLAPEYTDDGGHLNDEGKLLVAAGFLRSLSQSLQDRAASGLEARQAAVEPVPTD